MKKYRFYKKEHEGKIRWWVDIRPWVFPNGWLKMYPSAEAWLDKISEGEEEITIAYSTEVFEDAEVLHQEKFEGLTKGTLYIAKSYKNTSENHQVLLCPVTLYVFGRYPKDIYYRVL